MLDKLLTKIIRKSISGKLPVYQMDRLVPVIVDELMRNGVKVDETR